MSDLPTDRRFIGAVEGVPASPSPISNAVVVGDTCWISVQLSVGDDGRYRPGTACEEAERAFELVFRIAEAAGFRRDDIVYGVPVAAEPKLHFNPRRQRSAGRATA